MVKLKKVFATCLVAASIITTSQSAFATDGQADTMDTALALNPHFFGYHTIYDNEDVDWFVYTNNSGTMHNGADFELHSPAGYNYNLYMRS